MNESGQRNGVCWRRWRDVVYVVGLTSVVATLSSHASNSGSTLSSGTAPRHEYVGTTTSRVIRSRYRTCILPNRVSFPPFHTTSTFGRQDILSHPCSF